MSELIRTRCATGWLVITDQAIKVERKGGGGLEILPRQSLVSVSMQNRVPPEVGHGGGHRLTFNGPGDKSIRADFVNADDAKKIMELLGFA